MMTTTMRKKPIFGLVYVGLLALLLGLAVACGGETASEDADAYRDPAKGGAPQLIDPATHNSGQAWGRTECGLCHVGSSLADAHDFSPAFAASFDKIGEDGLGYSFCLYCHGDNGITSVTEDDYECLPCHTDSSVVSSASQFAGAHRHDADGSGSFGNGDCITCHEFSDMDGTMDYAVDLSQSALGYSDTTDFCLTCHDANGAFGSTTAPDIYTSYMTTGIHGADSGDDIGYGDFRGTYATGDNLDCTTCHAVHSSPNTALFVTSGAAMTAADATAQAASISVDGVDVSELCAICHQTPSGPVTTNGLVGIDHGSLPATSCTNCHYHGSGGLF